MTSETQCCDNVVTTLSDVATKIQPKPNVVTTLCGNWVVLPVVIMKIIELKWCGEKNFPLADIVRSQR